MADGLEHEPFGIEPERGVVAGVIFGEFLRCVNDAVAPRDRPRMHCFHGRTRLDDEGKVLESRPQPGVVARCLRAVKEDSGSGLSLQRLVRELVVYREEKLVADERHEAVVVLASAGEVRDVQSDVSERHRIRRGPTLSAIA